MFDSEDNPALNSTVPGAAAASLGMMMSRFCSKHLQGDKSRIASHGIPQDGGDLMGFNDFAVSERYAEKKATQEQILVQLY